MSRGLRAVLGVVLIIVGAIYYQPLVAVGISLVVGAALEKTPARLRRLLEQSVMVRSAVAPQEVVYGETRKSGIVTWYDANGSNNKYLWFVVTVAEHEINSYSKLWIDNVEIDVVSQIDVDGYATHAAFIDADGNKLVKAGFYTGTDSQTADPELVASTAYWTTAHRGQGVAYFWVRLEIDASIGPDPDAVDPSNNVWAKGWPRDLGVVLQGAKVYDPRLDDLNGGTGTHRVDTASTWEWSNNSVLCRADYIRSDRFGPGFTSADVDWATVATQADIADELVDIPDSATQKRYTLNGIIYTSDAPKEIVESMQTADHGTTLFLPGGIQILTGQWAASSHTIDSSWLAGAMTASSAIPTDNAYNAVRGSYLSAEKDYTIIGFEPRTSTAYETEDGVGRKWSDVALGFTTEEFAAQRLAIIELKKSRQQATLTLDCNFRGDLVQLWEVVTVDLPGYSSDSSPSEVKTYRVTSKTSKADSIVTLTLREEVESDWTYEVTDIATPPVVPDVTRGEAGPLGPEGLAASTVVNGVRLEWTNPSMSGISHIEVYAASSNNRSGAVLLTRTASESYTHELAEGVVRYYWILARGTSGLVSEWEPVSDTAGIQGTAGAAGADGADADRLYIKATNGTALHNSVSGDDATITNTTISAINVNNRFFDTNNGFVGFNVGDHVRVTGFTNAGNNITDGIITQQFASVIYIEGSEGDTIVDESAGNEVTISVLSLLTLEAHKTTGSSDALLASGDIKLYVGATEVNTSNGFPAPSTGYVGTLGPDQIDNDVVVELRDDIAVVTYDSITLVDYEDGGDGYYGYITASQALAWTRAPDQTTWTPSSATLQMDVTFISGGIEIARVGREFTRDSDGVISDNGAATHGDGNLNTSRISFVALDDVSQSVTGKFTYSYAGNTAVVSETTVSSLGGENGISAGLTNSNPVIPCDVEGYNYPLSTQTVDGAGGTFQVIQGDTDITGDVAGMYEQDTGVWDSTSQYTSGGLTLTINTTTGVYTCTVSSSNSYRAWTGDILTIPVRVLVDGAYHIRQYTVTKTLNSVSLSVDKLKTLSYVIAPTSGIGTASFRMDSDGDYYHILNGGTATNEGTWLLSGTATEYDVRVTLLDGDSARMSGSSLGAWHDLVSDKTFTLTDITSDAPETVNVSVQIRRNTGGVILVDRNVFMSADYTVA